MRSGLLVSVAPVHVDSRLPSLSYALASASRMSKLPIDCSRGQSNDLILTDFPLSGSTTKYSHIVSYFSTRIFTEGMPFKLRTPLYRLS